MSSQSSSTGFTSVRTPLQFSIATTTPPLSSIARITFRLSPPIGHPVTSILGRFSRCFPCLYSVMILSITSFTTPGVVAKSNRYLLPCTIFWISSPFTGAGSSFINSQRFFNDIRISLFKCTASRIISSVITI